MREIPAGHEQIFHHKERHHIQTIIYGLQTFEVGKQIVRKQLNQAEAEQYQAQQIQSCGDSGVRWGLVWEKKSTDSVFYE